MASSWDETIATGVASIDAEHRLQVSLVDALEELVRQGIDAPLLHRTLAQLVDFTRAHFSSEELMMRLHAYPQAGAHQAEHVRLLAQVEELRRQVEAGEGAPALEAIQSLHRWLTAHIRAMDQPFAAWCAANGIRVR